MRKGALALTALCLFAAGFAAAGRYLPSHDAIGWHGLYHYYADILTQGRLPWWNPYSRGGEPFFPYWQLIGLLQPTYLAAAALQKLTAMPSVLAYSLHYFFQIYLFVLGIYLVLCFLTRDAAASLLVAILALLGFLPAVLRQNGAILGFVFIPLVHYFLLRFLHEPEEARRGLWLFLAATLTALALNSLIPVPLALFFLCLAAGLAAAGRGELRSAYAYLRTRAGARWLALSLGVSALLVLPVAALFAELRAGELFPMIRLLQHGGEQFPQCFATDLVSDLFDRRFVGDKVVSLTPWNLAGLLLEPFARAKSEITLFIGTLGLGAAVLAIRRPANAALLSALLLTLLPLAVAVNFGGTVHDAPFALQTFMLTALPFLKLTDVVQNYGVLTLYGLALLAGLGLRRLLASPLALALVVLAPLALKLPSKNWVALAVALCAVVILLFVYRRWRRPARIALAGLAFAVLAVEMIAYERFYLARDGALSRDYPEFLEQAGLLRSRDPDAAFASGREPFAFRDSDRFKPRKPDNLANPVTVYGRDVMEGTKSAFPSIYRRYIGAPDEWKRYPMWDHLYSTRYYYDWLVNVDPARQLASAGVTCPLLRVVDRGRAIEAGTAREAAEILNGAAAQEGTIALTSATLGANAAASARADACFGRRESMVTFSDADRQRYRAALTSGCPIHDGGAQPQVLRHDENSLLVSATAPAGGGYLYLADGYSRHWKATVDGSEAPVRLANLAFKAIELAPGTHRVELRYDPVVFRYALWLYFAGLVLQAGVTAAAMRRFFARRDAAR